MESVLECLPQGSRVAILRLRSLGDCVLTTPALDILKRARPDLRVAVVVEDRFRAIFEGNPDVDAILPPDLGALRRMAAAALSESARRHAQRLDDGALGRPVPRRIRALPPQFVYNVRIPRAQEILGVERKVHTAEHLASAMFYLGAPMVEIPRAKLARRLRRAGGGGLRCHPSVRRRRPRRPGGPTDFWRSPTSEAIRHGCRSSSAGRATTSRRFAASARIPGAPLGEIK